MKRKTGTGGGYFGGVSLGSGTVGSKTGVTEFQKIVRESRVAKPKGDPFDVKCIGFGGSGEVGQKREEEGGEEGENLGK